MEFKIRDGTGFGAEMKKVGPLKPVFFENLKEEDYRDDADFYVVHPSEIEKAEPPQMDVGEPQKKRRGRPRKVLSL